MTAVLCRHFGLAHMEIAEDLASDAFLKASEHWAIHGVPENPVAWLYTTARNKAKDLFKRDAVFETKIKGMQESAGAEPQAEFEFTQQAISDSQLAMIFAVCDPVNAKDAQICLALQVLCGFRVEEIAGAFLTKPETIKKRLQRARTNLRNTRFNIKPLHEADVKSRLETVLKTLYLLFNEGYFSGTTDRQIRKDLCSEAMRLTFFLTECPLTDLPQTNALLALMCYQSSRLEARTAGKGTPILFDDQDRGRWDHALIQRGNHYLINATNGREVSKYHLEAGIAYWHTASTDKSKWERILQLYNELILMEYSPITALNRTFAFAKVYGHKHALPEAEKLNLPDNTYYHQLLGYLHADTDVPRAIGHYQLAMRLTKSNMEKQLLKSKIAKLTV